MIEAIHTACGKPAFHFDSWPNSGDSVTALTSKTRLLNGQRPQAGQLITCGTCGARVAAPLHASLTKGNEWESQ